MGKRSQLRRMKKLQEEKDKRIKNYNTALFLHWQALPFIARTKLSLRLFVQWDIFTMRVAKWNEYRKHRKAIRLKAKMDRRYKRIEKKAKRIEKK